MLQKVGKNSFSTAFSTRMFCKCWNYNGWIFMSIPLYEKKITTL